MDAYAASIAMGWKPVAEAPLQAVLRISDIYTVVGV